MGLNQSTAGSAKNSALINLHLATGQLAVRAQDRSP
jgi:assimilatory nitrate reductase catalytic subunit